MGGVHWALAECLGDNMRIEKHPGRHGRLLGTFPEGGLEASLQVHRGKLR
jgi:hypothetical protein